MLQILPTQGDDKTGEPGVVATDVPVARPPQPHQRRSDERGKDDRRHAAILGGAKRDRGVSRLRNDHGVLYMSTPSAARRPEGAQTTPPLGFVLSADRLITVRFMPLPAFDAVPVNSPPARTPRNPASRCSPYFAKRSLIVSPIFWSSWPGN